MGFQAARAEWTALEEAGEAVAEQREIKKEAPDAAPEKPEARFTCSLLSSPSRVKLPNGAESTTTIEGPADSAPEARMMTSLRMRMKREALSTSRPGGSCFLD